jgi:hypothetical protein
MELDKRTVEILGYIQSEIRAGESLSSRTEVERAHNNACERAIKIIQSYRDGYGLFSAPKES